jgi:DnaJ-class molecular chaperone
MDLKRLLNEPVALGVAIRMTLLAAIAFGLSMTDTQLVSLMAAVEAVLGLFTRQSVTPNQLAESRVQSAVSSGEAVTPKTATTKRAEKPVSCRDCHGTGRVPGVRPDQIVPCSTCGGTGTVLE